MKKILERGDILKYLRKTMRIMRLSLFLIMISTAMAFSATSYSQNTKLTLDLNNATVKEVIKAIEDQSEFLFFYQEKHVNLNRQVTLHATEQDVETILNQLFAETNNIYIINDRQIVIGVAPRRELEKQILRLKGDIKTVIEQPQQKEITGKVTDTDGLPLPGVSIIVKGTTLGTVTNPDGGFTLSVPSNAETLQFSFVGMKMQEIPLGGRVAFNVVMEEESIGLEEVVAIGYGTVKRRDLTGAVKSVSSDDLSKIPVPQIGQALAGRVAGVVVRQTSGKPGGVPSIRIRGGNSINGDNSPLFVVDGFISVVGAQEINPEDIKSVEILKDASATAIYGSRGANGVVLITTKSGRTGEKVQINMKSYIGLQQIIKKMDMMDAPQHAKYLNDYARYRGLMDFVENPELVKTDTDWQDEMLQKAMQQSHYLSFSGGSEKVAFNTSIDLFDQNGIVLNSGYERFGARTKLDINLSENIKSGIQLSFRKSRTEEVTSIFKDVLDVSPTMPVYDEEGAYNYLLSYDTPGVEVNNPIEELKEYTMFTLQKVLGLQGFVDFRLIGDLYFKSELSYNWRINKLHNFIPSTTLNGRQNLSTASLKSNQKEAFETVNTFRWDKYLHDLHHVNFVIGCSTINEDAEMFSAKAKDVASDVLLYYDLSSGDPLQNSVTSDYSTVKQLSFLGRANYIFNEKYLFTVSGRYDGSSNFGVNNRFAFFPSGAFAWRLSEENFVKELNLFDNLKLRLTYGITGNQSIEPYKTLSLLEPGKLPLGSQQTLGYLPVNIANPDLLWETTEQFNGGMDFGFFDNKIQFTVDYYHKKTRDLLLAKAIPSTTGFNSMLDNIGSIENKGFELEAKAMILEKGVGWNIDLNFSINRSRILDLGDTDFIFPDDSKVTNAKTNRTNILKVGEPIGAFYTYVFDGIFHSPEEIGAYPHISDTKPGGVRIKNLNNDEIISEADKTITGYAEPNFIFGVNNELSLFTNKVNISMFWQGVVGGKILNYDRYLFSLNASNVPTYMNNRWTANNTNTNVPAAGYAGLLTDNYIEDGSYLRLKNLSISYNLPQSILNKISIQAASLFITGYDLITFTNYSGINPEVNYFHGSNAILNADFNSYPTTKSYTLGINIKF